MTVHAHSLCTVRALRCGQVLPSQAMDADTFRGYMTEVQLRGDTLTVHGTNKAARVALAGQDHATDPTIPLDTITHVEWKGANRMVNGALTVHVQSGKVYRLHFRRKQQPDFERLAQLLDSGSAVHLCPQCGHELHTLHPFCRCGCTYTGQA